MKAPHQTSYYKFNQNVIAVATIGLALLILFVTWLGVQQSRRDSLDLLISQGASFTEGLAQAAENAIKSEQIIDYYVRQRFAELIRGLNLRTAAKPSSDFLRQASLDQQIEGIYIFDNQAKLVHGAAAHQHDEGLPEFIYEEVAQLIQSPENNFVLLLDEGDGAEPPIHYYLEITSGLHRVIVIVDDATFYAEALRETQIGYLAQGMAREKGVEYIIYQAPEGIIFSSRRSANLLSIESDPFLSEALEADTISYREIEFEGEPVLELVRPFSSPDFRFGLLRVGLSLQQYLAISQGYNLRLLIITLVMAALVLATLLFLRARRIKTESEMKYEKIKSVTDRIFEQMKTGVAAINHKGAITLTNAAFENIISMQKLVGKSWNDISRKIGLNLEKLEALGDKSTEPEVTVSINGQKKVLLIALSGLGGSEKEEGEIILVFYDITKLKEFETESARRERLSEMGQLAAGVAHEIRNPLNAISIAAQRLASEFRPSENEQEYLSIANNMRSESKRLDNIITKFLAMAKSEQKQTEEIDIKEYFLNEIKVLEVEATELGIELTFQIEDGLKLTADKGSLMQLVTNFYNNSKEALNGKPGKFMISASRTESGMMISFDDSGPGIEQDVANEIFRPFFTTKDSGTGLGLPTIDRIVRELGGQVRLEKSKLGGANFVVTLPKS
ncbi:MAG: hypothetical protein IIC66_02240 [candidate division Zixibacteria bacterium]|nr:hypothetical protein [candidate division Zixibacteria bacterium]